MESNDKRRITLLVRVSKGRRANKNLGHCRLCFKDIKKGQAFRMIEEEYGGMYQYLVHTKCLKTWEEKNE